MDRYVETALADQDRALQELLGSLRDPVPGERWVFSRQHKAWRPPTDVYETTDCFIVKVEIAGMQRSDLHVSLQARELTVSGIRKDSSTKVGYQQMEIQYGPFESHVSLPAAVDEDAIDATYQDGFLIIRLSKAKAYHVRVTCT
jgi:HSP20 family protein